MHNSHRRAPKPLQSDYGNQHQRGTAVDRVSAHTVKTSHHLGRIDPTSTLRPHPALNRHPSDSRLSNPWVSKLLGSFLFSVFRVEAWHAHAQRMPFSQVKYLWPVTLPKAIVIFNGKLACIQLTLLVVVVLGLVFSFWVQRKYEVQFTPQMEPNAWFETDATAYSAAKDRDMQSNVCRGNDKSKYNFQYGSGNGFVYRDWECVAMPGRKFYKEGRDGMFVPTFFQETYSEYMYTTDDCTNTLATDCVATPRAQSDNCDTRNQEVGKYCFSAFDNSRGSCMCSMKHNYLVAGASAEKLVFEHSVNGGSQVNVKGSSSMTVAAGEGERLVLSVVVALNEEIREEVDCGIPSKGSCRFDPGTNPALTLADWVKAGDVTLDLDNAETMSTVAAENYFSKGSGSISNAFTKPILRMTGVDVAVTVAYFDDGGVDLIEVEAGGAEDEVDDTTVIGLVTVESKPRWQSYQTLHVGDIGLTSGNPSGHKSSERLRYMYGVRFSFQPSADGIFTKFDFYACMAAVAVLSVYSGFVVTIVKQIAIRLLGDTSRAYKRALVDTFNIEREAQQTLPARVLEVTSAFHRLCDLTAQAGAPPAKDNDGRPYITKYGVMKILTQVFEGDLHSDMIKTMSQNCYESIAHDEQFGKSEKVGSGMLGQKAEEMTSTTDMRKDMCLGVSLPLFVKALLKREALDMGGLGNIYDTTDSQNCCEKVLGDHVQLKEFHEDASFNQRPQQPVSSPRPPPGGGGGGGGSPYQQQQYQQQPQQPQQPQ